MPKSRHRKSQKKKAQNRTKRMQAEQKKQMNEYLKQLQAAQAENEPIAAPYNPNKGPNPYKLGE